MARPFEALTPPRVAHFLEQLGMWEEAKALRRPQAVRPVRAGKKVVAGARPIATPQVLGFRCRIGPGDAIR